MKNLGIAHAFDPIADLIELDDVHSRLARELDVLLAISTDTHALDQLGTMRLGVATARRPWVGPAEVINTWPVDKLRAWARTSAAAQRRRAAGRGAR